MSIIKNAMNKLPEQSRKTIEVYSSLIEQYTKAGNQLGNEEYRHKLRGYLTSLLDLGVINHIELRSLYLWYACDRYDKGVR